MTTSGRNPRATLTLPAALIREARAVAPNDAIADFVRNAILTATQAAEQGRGPLPSAIGRRPRGSSNSSDTPRFVTFRFLCPKAEEVRCDRALKAQGSDMTAVAEAALEAFVEARGSRLDARIPGNGWAAQRHAGAA